MAGSFSRSCSRCRSRWRRGKAFRARRRRPPYRPERPVTTAPPGPMRMEALSPAEKPPTFVMRGGPVGPARLVFLHGMCGHGARLCAIVSVYGRAPGRAHSPAGRQALPRAVGFVDGRPGSARRAHRRDVSPLGASRSHRRHRGHRLLAGRHARRGSRAPVAGAVHASRAHRVAAGGFCPRPSPRAFHGHDGG